jgi:crotonobetainyl-CoA:carnitine CoA-transferase CaiB-like acyl-CoA transferase
MAVDILAALHWREMTGDGQALEVAVAEAYASVDDWASLRYQGAGSINKHYGSPDKARWLYCFAPTKDGADNENIYLRQMSLGSRRLEAL